MGMELEKTNLTMCTTNLGVKTEILQGPFTAHLKMLTKMFMAMI